MKRFVKSVLSKLDISPSTTHVAAIAYSTYPVVEMRFWNSQSTDKSNDVIDTIPWQRGFTYTDKALQLAATDLFQIENGMRSDVNKVRQKGTPSSLTLYVCLLITLTCSPKAGLRRAQLNGIGQMHLKGASGCRQTIMNDPGAQQPRCF